MNGDPAGARLDRPPSRSSAADLPREAPPRVRRLQRAVGRGLPRRAARLGGVAGHARPAWVDRPRAGGSVGLALDQVDDRSDGQGDQRRDSTRARTAGAPRGPALSADDRPTASTVVGRWYAALREDGASPSSSSTLRSTSGSDRAPAHVRFTTSPSTRSIRARRDRLRNAISGSWRGPRGIRARQEIASGRAEQEPLRGAAPHPGAHSAGDQLPGARDLKVTQHGRGGERETGRGHLSEHPIVAMVFGFLDIYLAVGVGSAQELAPDELRSDR
jgi:hypothetical protein